MSSETAKLPNKKQMLSLINAINENKTRVGALNGAVGARVNEFCENGNGNKKVLGLAAWMMRSDELRAREFIGAMRQAFEMVEEELDKTGHAGDLIDQAENDADEAEQRAADRVSENVSRLEAGIKPIETKDEAGPIKPPKDAVASSKVTPLKVGGGKPTRGGKGVSGTPSAH